MPSEFWLLNTTSCPNLYITGNFYEIPTRGFDFFTNKDILILLKNIRRRKFFMKLLSLLLLLSLNSHAESVFYNTCDETKTSANRIQTGDKCGTVICEMHSQCKSNKGEFSVSHLCPSLKNGKCPTMIDCLDNETITGRASENLDPSKLNGTGIDSSSAISK